MKVATSKPGTMQHKGYNGTIEVSIEDNCLHGRVLHIDDLVTYEGGTPAELKDEFNAAVDRYLSHCKQIGKAPNKPFSGTFNVRITPDQHKRLAQMTSQCGSSLNELIGRAVEMLLDGGRKSGELHVHHRHEFVASSQHSTAVATSAVSHEAQVWSFSTSVDSNARPVH